MDRKLKAEKYHAWVMHVADTQEDEVSCSQCLDLVSQYVDRELTEGDARLWAPALHHHLEQCQVCQDEYQLLLNMARLEAKRELPGVQELIDRLKPC